MGEKKSMILQSCRADVRVRRKDGETEIKVIRYKSLVDCLSVDEGGNGSESKSKEFKMLNWEGYVQERYVHWFSITTSDDKKYTFKLKQVPEAAAGGIFWVDLALNESLDVVGVLKNVNIELIELLRVIAEAPKKVPVATYNSGKKTLTYSKDELGYHGMRYFANMVGRTMGISFNKTPFDGHFLGGWSWDHKWWFYELFYAKVASVSVEGDNVFVWMTTDAKTKGKYAKEKVEALNNVESGDYYVGIYDPFSHGAAVMEMLSPAGMGAFSAQGINRPLSASIDIDEGTLFLPLSVSLDIGDVIGLANGRSRVGFRAKDARRLSFDAATETISSVLSNKYIEGMIDAPQLGIILRVKTKSGAGFVIAMDNLEKNGDIWAGESWWTVSFSSDDIVDAFLSSGSGKPLLIFPVYQW